MQDCNGVILRLIYLAETEILYPGMLAVSLRVIESDFAQDEHLGIVVKCVNNKDESAAAPR